MKKKLLYSLLLAPCLALASFISVPETPVVEESKPVIEDCNYGQCMATAASTGRRCRHCVSNPGDSYCWQH